MTPHGDLERGILAFGPVIASVCRQDPASPAGQLTEPLTSRFADRAMRYLVCGATAIWASVDCASAIMQMREPCIRSRPRGSPMPRPPQRFGWPGTVGGIDFND